MVLGGRRPWLRKAGESKEASGTTSRGDRQSGILSSVCGQTRTHAPKATRFNKLPSDEPGDAKPDFSRARDEGESKSAFARNSKQVPNHKIAAFLHSKTSGHCKRCRPDRQDGTLQDERVDDRRG